MCDLSVSGALFLLCHQRHLSFFKSLLLKNRFTHDFLLTILLWCPRSSQLAWTLLTPLASPQAMPTLTLWNLPLSTTCISDCAPPSCPASEMLPTPHCLLICQDLHQGSVSSRKTPKLLLVSCKMPLFVLPSTLCFPSFWTRHSGG